MKRTVILLVILALLVGGLAGCKKTPTEVGTRGTIERSGVIDVNGDGIQSWNGGTIATYSDAGSTLTWSITGSTGDLVAGDTIVFEGATADGYETTFAITDPTSSDKTITFPNSTGTVALNPYGASIEFEGATADGFETTLAVADTTDPDKTITLPDADGTVMLSTLATNAPDAANAVTGGTNQLIFEGATGAADAFETVLTPTDPTADNVITLPDDTGTVLLSTAEDGTAGQLFQAGQDLKFEGTTANAHEAMVRFPAEPTFDVIWQLPTGALVTDSTGNLMASLLATNGPNVANSVWGDTNVLTWEGSAADEHETSLSVTNPTGDRSVVFADGGGTVMLSSLATNATDAANAVTGQSNALAFEGATADGYETILTPTDATADRTVTLPDASGTLALTSENGFFFPLTADATAQVGDLVMPDAGTTNRFDVNTGNAAMPLGVLAGTGPSAQGTTGYPIVFAGLGRCAIQEDAAVTFSHWLIVSATAGKCNDSAAITTIGLNIGRALESAPVSNVIAHNGCTGGTGCINTALDTPNAGPAGQITLSADVAAQGWAVGDPVIYWNSGGTTPTGLTDGKVYFLASVATTNVTLSATKGGAVVVPSDQGDDATQYLQKLPLAAIHIN